MGLVKSYRSKKRKFAGNRYTNVTVKSNVKTVFDDVVDNNKPIETASSSKLKGYEQNFQSTSSHETHSELFGNRIIDLNILISVLAVLCCPDCLTNNLVLNEDSRFGLTSNFCIKCKNCGFFKGFSSTAKINNQNHLNTLVVFGLRLIGKGYHGGKKLFCLLDLPFLTKNTFRRQELKILQAASESAKESMIQAANRIMLPKGDKKTKRCVKKKITSCGVSMDGTWQKRGYSSMNGCVSCISVDSGKILDIEVMSNFCRFCKSSSLGAKHACKNHKGSSSSMETVGAYRIFERSEATRNLQYTTYYGDGDSKAFEAVKDMYGESSVTKLECIGHVQKRVGCRLRKLKKSEKGLGGKGKLTDAFIDRLQNYYGIAIRSNLNNLEAMQSAVIAAFFHCCSSVTHPMHGQCPPGKTSWCKYQQAAANNKEFIGKASGLPQNIVKIIKPTYMKLTDQMLLKKCLHGRTQNANESFNGLLWNIVPKQHFVELQTLTLGTYVAVIQFNDGGIGLISVLNKLNINVGSYTREGLKHFDHERVCSSKRHSLPTAKINRKKMRAQKKN